VSRLREWTARVRGFLGRRRPDLDEELAFHREMAQEHYLTLGHSPEESRRLAAIQVGGSSQIVDAYQDQRSLPMLETLIQDLRYGARMLRRAPGFTAAAVITLALGIGANTAIFTVVDAVLLRPLPYADPDRLVTIGDRNAEGMASTVGFLTAMDWRERSRTLEQIVLMRSWQPTLVSEAEAERLPAVRVSWNYFEMMGVQPALGRAFTADEDRPDKWRVLILSDQLWRRRFGADPSVVGRTVVMNDREYRVVGVMPASFEPLDAARFYAAAEVWAPLGYDSTSQDACRSCRHLRALARIKPGVTVAEVTAEMDGIRAQLSREYPTEFNPGSVAVVPLAQAINGSVRPALRVLLAAVGLVLFIACANVANLLLARSFGRRRELALRAALGAGRGRIVRQLLTESALLSLGGAVIGVGLALLAVQSLATLVPVSLPRLDQISVDARVLTFTAGLTLLTMVLFGLLPAWRGAGTGLQPAIASGGRGSAGGSSRARSLLVVANLALALVLLSGAGVMLRTVVALTRVDPGIDSAGVMTLQFSLVGKAYAEDTAVIAFQERLLDRLRGLPGVTGAALAGQIPFGDSFDCRGFHATGRMKPNTAEDPCIERYGVTPDYARVMGLRLHRGRFFDATDSATSQPVIVISQATASAVWGEADPIGTQVRLGNAERGPWRTVIGVVADGHHADLTAPVTAAVYTPQTQQADSYLVAIIKSAAADPSAVVGPVRAAIRTLDPAVPIYDVATMTSLVDAASEQHVFVMRLLSGFALVAVLLAATGLYGVLAYGISQRTREVGVRVALGARPADVMRLVLSEGALLTAAGLGLGLVGAFVGTRQLGALVYGVSAADLATFAAATGLLATVALASHVIPLRRALHVSPTVALRQE
jgi:putative ABC transport system permease protein